MAMAYAGAGGNTKAQMEQVLRLSPNGDNVHAAYRRITDSLVPKGDVGSDGSKFVITLRRVKDGWLSESKAPGYELDIINSTWVMKGMDVSKDYRNLMETYYSVPLEEADFRNDLQSAGRSINSCFEKQSRGRFKEVIAPGEIDSLTRLVLANAIYFKGKWESRFLERKRKEAPLTLLDGTKIKVPTMAQSHDFDDMETGGFKALRLPYKDSASIQ